MGSFEAGLENVGITEMLVTAKAFIGSVVLASVGGAPIHTEPVVVCPSIFRIRHAPFTLYVTPDMDPSSISGLVVTLPCIVEKETRNVNAKYFKILAAHVG